MKILDTHINLSGRSFKLVKDSGDYIDIDLPNDDAWKQFLEFWDSDEITALTERNKK